MPHWLSEKTDSIVLTVRVAPQKKVSAVLGLHGDALKIALSAPPVDGKANAALIEFLSSQLSVPQSSIQIIRGLKSKDKVVSICAKITAAQVMKKLLQEE